MQGNRRHKKRRLLGSVSEAFESTEDIMNDDKTGASLRTETNSNTSIEALGVQLEAMWGRLDFAKTHVMMLFDLRNSAKLIY